MKHKSRFRKEEQQEQESLQKQSDTNTKDFDSVEDVLRFDAAETRVPPGLGERLSESVKKEPKSSWWTHVFGGKE